MSETLEVLTPVGRIVGGHPMTANPVINDQTKQPKMQVDGVTPQVNFYVGLAILKGAEANWWNTEWGAKIFQAATIGWPNGEYQAPTFSWKITDGDSTTPNRAGRKPCEREGYPGHWVIQAQTGIPIKCYHTGKYDPTQQIQNKNEIKPGDYGRLFLNCRGNAPSQSPGVYVNPTMFDLVRAGIEIQLSAGPAASDAFATAGTLPVGAQVNTAMPGAVAAPALPGAVAAPALPGVTAPAPAPANSFLNPGTAEEKYNVSGQIYTRAQLESANWSPEQIAQCPGA